MARTMFEMGFSASPFEMGLNIKDITSKAMAPSSTPVPAAATVPAEAAGSTILGLPTHIAAIGGLSILGTIGAIAFGHG